MEKRINEYLNTLKFGKKQSCKNLCLFPLLAADGVAVDYLTLDEALPQGLIEVKEMNEQGSVPELRVTNHSPLLVLILDGEELVGAKQNRIVNTTILLKGKSTTVIPVSCVEQGRWSYSSSRFRTEKRMMSSNLRSRKAEQVNYSVREFGEFRSDQGAIWKGIAEKAERLHAESPTEAMASIYEKEMPSIEEYVQHFSPVDGQVGAVFMINGQVAGLDAFGRHDTFTSIFEKLVRSYALDAVDWFDSEKEHKCSRSRITAFLKSSFSANVEPHPSVGVGTDCRIESKKVAGFALVLDSQVLHVSLFARETQGGENAGSSRMQRSSHRRNRLL